MQTPVGMGILCAMMMIAGCGGREEQSPAPLQGNGRVVVAAVNYPLAYFAERIGGDQVEVVFPVPGDEDPAFWRPLPEDVATFQAANLILLNGASYAKWVARVTLPMGKVVDTSREFAEAYIQIEDTVTHSHGPGGDHAHTGTAFTTWLDFELAAEQARVVRDGLIALRPDSATLFESNFSAVEDSLSALDRDFMAAAFLTDQQTLLTSHPVYQYLARRYHLKLRSFMWEPDEVPDAAQWGELRRILERDPARWMIWESEPAAESVRRLEAMGVGSLVFDPCMNRRGSDDFLQVMRANVTEFTKAFN